MFYRLKKVLNFEIINLYLYYWYCSPQQAPVLIRSAPTLTNNLLFCYVHLLCAHIACNIIYRSQIPDIPGTCCQVWIPGFTVLSSCHNLVGGEDGTPTDPNTHLNPSNMPPDPGQSPHFCADKVKYHYIMAKTSQTI